MLELIEQLENILDGQEDWEFIKGTQERYVVTESGRVFSLWRGNGRGANQYRKTIKELKHIFISQKRYHGVKILIDGEGKMQYVHRLVAEAFLPNEDDLPQVNHKDADIDNNHWKNLEWCTAQENTYHAWENKLYAKGEDHVSAKLKNIEAKLIRKLKTETNITYNELAKVFNVNRSCISQVCNNKTYKDLD
jgi:hypothetical protein